MNLRMQPDLADTYKSPTQSVRVITEGWGARELYCAACNCDTLTRTPANTRAVDFRCPNCSCVYQLKSGKRLSNRIPDGQCDTMLRAINSDVVPNLLLLHYDADWCVKGLVLVPSFLLSPSAILRRRPLAPSARRPGWVGCIILLDMIPAEGRLTMVSGGSEVATAVVRSGYERVRPFSRLDVSVRGWALDVLRIAERVATPEFRLSDVYAHEDELAGLHPANNNIRPKIRQQLQVLRDAGLLEFVAKGAYRLVIR